MLCCAIPDLVLGLLIQRERKTLRILYLGVSVMMLDGTFDGERERRKGDRKKEKKRKESACATSTLTLKICFIMQHERMVYKGGKKRQRVNLRIQ